MAIKKPRWKLSGNLASETLQGEEPYEGPTPSVSGVYPVKLSRLTLAANSSDDPMFKMVAPIEAPKGDYRAKFNGYPVWTNINVTEKAAGFVNAFLEALGLDSAQKKKFWSSSSSVTLDDAGNVVSIAGKKIKPGMLLRLFCEYDGEYQNLKGRRFLTGKPSSDPIIEDDEDEDDDDEEETEDEIEDDDDDDLEDDAEEDDVEDDDDDEEDDDEDEDEPEPPKKPAKAKPAKKVTKKVNKKKPPF